MIEFPAVYLFIRLGGHAKPRRHLYSPDPGQFAQVGAFAAGKHQFCAVDIWKFKYIPAHMLMNFGCVENPKVQGMKRENTVFQLYFFAHNNDESGGVFLQNKSRLHHL